MKELSIEEKAKRYDEAVEKLRSLHDDYDTVSTLIDIKEELENIFPELKIDESEDERIRKGLIEYFLHYPDHEITYYGLKADFVIAWLEKQGKNNMGISEATKKKLEDNLNKALEKETPESFNEFLDEQKPAWNEEDENIKCSLVYLIEEIIRQPLKRLENWEGYITWLKTLKDRVQPKREWSEKDKKHLNRAINILDASKIYTKSPDKYEGTINWLKSLRPQKQWKPSDEQMKALADALSLAKNCGEEIAFDLRTLHEQLKKLREE